jgi:hypothetical protein
MQTVEHSGLINIVNAWTEKNSPAIKGGLKVGSPIELLKYERLLLSLLIQLGAMIMEWILRARVEDHEFQKHASDKIRATGKFRFQAYETTPVRTSFGNTVRVTTRYYVPRYKTGKKSKSGRRGKSGSGLFPALDALGIFAGATPALLCEVGREVTLGPSMEAAQDSLSRRGLCLDIKVVQRLSEWFAATGLFLRDAFLLGSGRNASPLVPPDEKVTGMRVLLSVDGGRSRIRVNKRGRIPKGNKRHGFGTDWREPKLFTMRILDPLGKVIKKYLPINDGTFGDADDIFTLIEAHLRARDIWNASEIICAADGAPWIWERMATMLEKLGVDMARVSFVVDFYHAQEHLTKVADERRGWTELKRARWLNSTITLLRMGKIDEVIEGLKALARGRNARGVMREVGYFEEHKERMRYDELERKGLPLGSGAMESTIRQVVNLRLKGAGMFWLLHNAEGFLHLRCYLMAGRWDIIENAIINHKGVVQ